MINSEDRLRRHVIMALICELTLDVKECEREFGVDFFAHFADAIANLRSAEADGLIQIGRDQLQVTPEGRPFLRNSACPSMNTSTNMHARARQSSPPPYDPCGDPGATVKRS
jgi:oxygen-independent coproporphyrinogen-3 oxidase